MRIHRHTRSARFRGLQLLASVLLVTLSALLPNTSAQAITLTTDGLESAEAATCVIDIDSLRNFTFYTTNAEVFQAKKDTSTYSTTSLIDYEVSGVYIWGTPEKGPKTLPGYFELTWDDALLDNEGRRHDLHARFSNITVNWKHDPGVGEVSQQLLRITDNAIRINAEPEALIRWDSAEQAYKSRFTNAWVDGVFYALGVSCDVTFWNDDSSSLKYNLYAQDIDQPDRFTGNTLASCRYGTEWTESFSPSSMFSTFHVAENTSLFANRTTIYGTMETEGDSEKLSGFVSLGTMSGSSSPLSFTWKGSACSTRILQDWSYVLRTRVINAVGGTIYAKTDSEVEIKDNRDETWNETGMVPRSSYLVTATPDDGYHIHGMWLNGKRLSNDEIAAGSVSLPNISKDYYVSVMFVKDDPETGTVTLVKSSADSSVTDDNPCYSLEGAEYGVYSDQECEALVGTLETDSSGKTGDLSLIEGTYYVKETKAPTGYALDETVHEVAVSANDSATVEISDVPQGNPIDVMALKVDADTKKATPQGAATLAGAEFTVSYYAGYYEDDELPSSATRTWVIKTDADGKGHLDEGHLVSGDAFYLFDGNPGVPLGTISIRETKAPEGYALPQATASNVQQIRSSSSDSTLSGFVEPSVKSPTESDPVIRGGVMVKKTNKTGETALAGAVFSITSENDEAVVVGGKQYAKGEACLSIMSGTDGIAGTAGDELPYGSYTIRETKAPEGYHIDETWSESFSIKKSGEIVDLTSHPLKNDRITTSVSLKAKKVFDGSSQGRTLEADMFSFELLDSDDKVIQTMSNDESGYAAFSTLVFDHQDAGKEYTYKIREVRGTDEEIVYDTHVEEVVVSLQLVDGDTLKATVKTDDDGIVFHNQTVGALDMPLTGREGLRNMVPGALTALVAGGTLVGRQATKRNKRRRRRR